MEMLGILNVSASLLLVCLCAIAFERSTTRGDAAFSVLFGSVWLLLAIFYLISKTVIPYIARSEWILQCIDMTTNFLLLMASYALYQSQQFTPNSPSFRYLAQFAIFFVAITGVSGFVSSDHPTWHIFKISANQMLACGSVIALGYVAGIRFPAFSGPLRLVCAYYALLQVPSFYISYVQPHADVWYVEIYGLPKDTKLPAHSDNTFIDAALVGGKFMFVLCALVIDRTINTARQKSAATALFVLNAGLSIALAAIKIGELIKNPLGN